jgi:hypothetical protein
MEKLFLKLMDIWVKVRTQNFFIKNIFRIVGNSLVQCREGAAEVCGPVLVEYVYNGRVYKYVTAQLEQWPPNFGASRFVMPIKSVTFGDQDITTEWREHAGPRQDGDVDPLILTGEHKHGWFVEPTVKLGTGLAISFEFLRRIMLIPRQGVLRVTNIFGQTAESTVGAK